MKYPMVEKILAGENIQSKNKVKPLYKTTVVIWSEEDLTDRELSDAAREAEAGDAYCSVFRSRLVKNPDKDPSWDGTEFFDDNFSDY